MKLNFGRPTNLYPFPPKKHAFRKVARFTTQAATLRNSLLQSTCFKYKNNVKNCFMFFSHLELFTKSLKILVNVDQKLK